MNDNMLDTQDVLAIKARLVTEAVTRGAELFDQLRPGWWTPERFDLDIMSVSSMCVCPAAIVLGDGDWATAVRVLENEKPGERDAWNDWPIEDYGFASFSRYVDDVDVVVHSGELTDVWRDAVNARRQQDTNTV